MEHYAVDIPHHPSFQDISSISDLCALLVETGLSKHYVLIDRLICLVLTLPVTTVTTERAFSAMKFVKTTLRNKMEDEFLTDCLTIYIKREFSETIDLDSVIDEFYAIKHRRIQFQ